MERFGITAQDGVELAAFEWPVAHPKAVVQLAHGAAEHLGRYDRFARFLNKAGFHVVGADHRGHGANASGGLGSFGEAGFAGVVEDMAAVARAGRSRRPGTPLVLFAHSMGSFAAQVFLTRHPDLIDGLILSGTAAIDELLTRGDHASGLQAFGAGMEAMRTPFDWLSRDAAEVDAYIADPLCGFDLDQPSVVSMAAEVTGVRDAHRLAAAARRQIPVHVISGEEDPVGGPAQSSARTLVESYRAAGLRSVQHRIYPGGRHEMLNEINREVVMQDIVDWLDAVI